MGKTGSAGKPDLINLVTFRVGDLCCAFDMEDVDEIKRTFIMTHVCHAPEYVCGIMNLRGKIVTVIDICKKMAMQTHEACLRHNLIIVHKDKEQVALLVDGIEDTVAVGRNEIEHPPSTIDATLGRYLSGIYRTSTNLIAVLNTAVIIEKPADGDTRHTETTCN